MKTNAPDFTPVPDAVPTDEEITRCLAEDAMGWTVRVACPGVLHFQRPDSPWTFMWALEGVDPQRSDLFSPLTSIANAFVVVPAMAVLGWMLELDEVRLLATDRIIWRARFRKWGSTASECAEHENPATAIGIAAYAAIKGKAK